MVTQSFLREVRFYKVVEIIEGHGFVAFEKLK